MALTDPTPTREVTIRVPVIAGQSMDEAFAVALRVADRRYEIFDSTRMLKRRGEWLVVFRVVVR